MSSMGKLRSIILWIARVFNSILLVFVLVFLLAHIVGNNESGEGFSTTGSIVEFICFPLGLIVGLLLAWRWEGVGGLVSTLSIITLFVLRPDLISDIYMILMIIPGLLFLLYWFLYNIITHQGQKPISH